MSARRLRLALLPAAALTAGPPAAAGPLVRVEALSDDAGDLLWTELPLLAARPGGVGLRALGQVQPVFALGPVQLGASVLHQSVQLERSFAQPGGLDLRWTVGLPTRLGLPVGAFGTLGITSPSGLWLGLGAAARSDAGWSRPDFTVWTLRPTAGLGWAPRGARPGAVSPPPPPPAPAR